MLKASALYIVIVIALVIAVICSSLIVSAYYYRMEYQKVFRYDRLQNNLGSAVNILLAGDDTSYSVPKSFSLFGSDADSVSTERIFWGIFDIGVAKAMIQSDTLYKVFSIANRIDSSKWAAIYLTDNGRPFSLSGKTNITGNVFISPAGVSQAYVNNQAYSGDKRLITGKKLVSEKTLPVLNTDRLQKFEQLIKEAKKSVLSLPEVDSINNSFVYPVKIYNFKGIVTNINHIKLSGNIILFSDTTLIIDSTASLTNLIVFAKSITIHSGFHGSCQLFATDSISIQKNCRFEYPSSLGILRFAQTTLNGSAARIALYHNSQFFGSIFNYEKYPNKLSPIIHIGKEVKVKGQLYSQGYMEFEDKAEVDGSVFTDRFLYQSSFTRYENYLINTTINSKMLSSYYLTGELLPVATKHRKILKWLEAN